MLNESKFRVHTGLICALSEFPMNAPLRAPTPSALEDTLIRDGFYSFGEALDPDDAAKLLQKVRAARQFGPGLFLSQDAFEADPQFKGVNPRPGRNLAERFESDLAFVEDAPVIKGALTHVLGPDYKIIDRKFVCGVPETWLPPWLLARIKGNPVNNLGAYVKPDYRDITYFYGIDFHQDLIDHPDRTADFITLYVYLHPVTNEDAPLYVLPRSHQFGGTTFPHDLLHDGHERWLYKDRRGGEAILPQKILTGGPGYAALWHACTLHGTQPDTADRERISLRYVIQRGKTPFAAIDRVNAMLRGPLSLKQTRVDLDIMGATQMKTNHITGQS
jgi:hypothetical protein